MIQKNVFNRLDDAKNLCLTMQGGISFDFPDWNVHSRQGDSVTLIVDVECWISCWLGQEQPCKLPQERSLFKEDFRCHECHCASPTEPFEMITAIRVWALVCLPLFLHLLSCLSPSFCSSVTAWKFSKGKRLAPVAWSVWNNKETPLYLIQPNMIHAALFRNSYKWALQCWVLF